MSVSAILPIGRSTRRVAKAGQLDASNPRLLDMPLLPDPDKVRIRVYQTYSTHKSMSALRQGSIILIWDDDFHRVEGSFKEAFLTHTSTSPNLQIIASLDVARRQMELEGYELTMRATELAFRIRREVNGHPLISRYFHITTPAEMVPASSGRRASPITAARSPPGRISSTRGTATSSHSTRRG